MSARSTTVNTDSGYHSRSLISSAGISRSGNTLYRFDGSVVRCWCSVVVVVRRRRRCCGQRSSSPSLSLSLSSSSVVVLQTNGHTLTHKQTNKRTTDGRTDYNNRSQFSACLLSIFSALFSVFCALCSVLSALCSLLSALCSLLSALCFVFAPRRLLCVCECVSVYSCILVCCKTVFGFEMFAIVLVWALMPRPVLVFDWW